MRGCMLLAAGVLVGCGGQERPVEGTVVEEPPESEAVAVAPRGMAEAEIVGPGTISTDLNQTFPAIDPVTGDLWYSEYERSFDDQTILVARATSEGWSTPEVASFSGRWGDRAPRFSPDGSVLYFTSNRPRPGAPPDGDMNIWAVTRTQEGWSEPAPAAALNSSGPDMHVSVSDRAIWVASRREGGFGRSDLYRVEPDETATNVGSPLNDELSQPDLWVASDESWMLLAVTEHPDGLGGDDLYVARFTNGAWTEPRNLGPAVNTAEYEYGPWVAGDYLYFTSHRDGPSHVYRIPLARLAVELEP